MAKALGQVEKEKPHTTGATCKRSKRRLLGGSGGMKFWSILEQKFEYLNRTQISLNFGLLGRNFQRKVGSEFM